MNCLCLSLPIFYWCIQLFLHTMYVLLSPETACFYKLYIYVSKLRICLFIQTMNVFLSPESACLCTLFLMLAPLQKTMHSCESFLPICMMLCQFFPFLIVDAKIFYGFHTDIFVSQYWSNSWSSFDIYHEWECLSVSTQQPGCKKLGLHREQKELHSILSWLQVMLTLTISHLIVCEWMYCHLLLKQYSLFACCICMLYPYDGLQWGG